ncbi:hypothetical protein [uncultured Bacteroides sp.]|uniref:hypothetical protein n=1 Tax=uncultured Bacteroides sp. TaxID=162156 RepID=UPI002AA8E471|nr:hypothetical protein [uncultured Bacteroides sp.]
MSYGLIYTIPFKNSKNVSYTIEIEKDGYTGESTELTGGQTPFTVTIDDEEFLYTPSKFSTANIRIVGEDYLQQLYSTAYQEWRITFKAGEVAIWCGFIKPELYTQDYSSTPFELEIECLSAMSTLEYINYEQKGTDGRIFVTLWNLLTGCVNSANGKYESIILPHVYAKNASDYANAVNVLEQMKISEQNFFDEDDKAMTLKEILEEICKFLNWTCQDWKGKLYFVDIDHAGDYWEYSTDFSTHTVITKNEMNVQDINFGGNGHTLGILGGYNKCSVKTSNYNVGDVFPTEDYDSLTKLHYMTDTIWPTDNTKGLAKRFFYPNIYSMRHFSEVNLSEVTDLSTYNTDDAYGTSANRLLGALPIKRQIYSITNGTPDIVDYSFEELIQVRGCVQSGAGALGQSTKLISFSSDLPSCIYGNGAIALDCYMQGCVNNDMSTISKSFTKTPKPYIKCRLSIGDKFWNGSEWVADVTATFNIGFNENDLAKGGFVQVDNDRSLNDGYDGLSGVVIPLTEPIYGRLVFEMAGIHWKDGASDYPYSYLKGYFLKGLSLQYKLDDDYKTDDDADRIYENVIAENYINELDEIDNKISSYNYDNLSYSKVLLGADYLTNNLYSIIENRLIRLEEQLIRRIIGRYAAPRLKLTQQLLYSHVLSPFTILSDNYMVNKRFIPTGGEIDFQADKFEIQMLEL